MKHVMIMAVAALFFSSCDKVTNLNFSQTSSTGTSTIPANTCTSVDQDCDGIDLNKVAQDNGTSLDLLKEVVIKSATFKTTSTDNFKEFESVELSITADGKDPLVLMSKTGISTLNKNPLDMDVTQNINVLDYMKAPNWKINVKAILKDCTTAAQDVSAELTYNVKAGL